MTSESNNEGKLLQFPGPGRRHIDEEMARGRQPLYVDRNSGRILGEWRRRGDPVADFGARLVQIRASVERLNALMAEVKRMSEGEPLK